MLKKAKICPAAGGFAPRRLPVIQKFAENTTHQNFGSIAPPPPFIISAFATGAAPAISTRSAIGATSRGLWAIKPLLPS